MYKRLQELGIPSVITRTDDEYLPKEERVKRIREIVRENPNKKIILISNHINAGNGEGAEVVYSLKNNSILADLILENIGEKGQIKRKIYQRRLPENPNQDYYYILRETNTDEPVLVEYGFIDNTNDSKKLKSNLLDYVEGVVKALAEYLGYNYNGQIENEYIVQRGDTLYSIAKQYNVTVDELKKLNNLTTDSLSIGQKLKLKEDNLSEKQNIYIVQKGDTLYSTAKQYNVTIEDIKEVNNLITNSLKIGEELLIPNNDIDNEEEEIEENEYELYYVEKGDSLWKISRKFNITVEELIKINNLSNLTLKIGQALLVPKRPIEDDYYTVKSGDTLWSIAKSNNIEVSELKELNDLNSNLLSVGQKLKIK